MLLQQTSCDWEVPPGSLPTPPPLRSPLCFSPSLSEGRSPGHTKRKKPHRYSYSHINRKGTTMWQLIAGPLSYFQLCWLDHAATLLNKCDGHSVLGEVGVIPADKDIDRLYSSCAVLRCIKQRNKWPDCSKLTTNRKKKVNVTHCSILS